MAIDAIDPYELSVRPSLHDKWLEESRRLGVAEPHLATMEGFLSDMEAHHEGTYEHSMRVGLLAPRIGALIPELEGLPPKVLLYAGTMHDWGKLKTPSELLAKTTDWTEEDARALRAHPVDSYEALTEEGMTLTAGAVILHHTFQPDPYPEKVPDPDPQLPERLVRLQPVIGRVIALADFYDASHRKDSGGSLTGEQIKDKMYKAHSDLTDLLDRLYEEGVFTLS